MFDQQINSFQTLFCITEFVYKIQERVINPGTTTKALKKLLINLQNPQTETLDTVEVLKNSTCNVLQRY